MDTWIVESFLPLFEEMRKKGIEGEVSRAKYLMSCAEERNMLLHFNDDIAEYTAAALTAYRLVKDSDASVTMKNMKDIIEIVRDRYPGADASLISKTVQKVINSKGKA